MSHEKYRIMIETSSICNARCTFCANASLLRPKAVMSDELFHLIMERLIKEEVSVERFILHLNGEPFTDNHLIERIKLLKSRFKDVPIWFTTNFSLPDHNTIDRLLESGADQITISLNAVQKEKYHEITGLDFDRTMANIRYLTERNQLKGSPLKVRFSIVDCGKEEDVEEFRRSYSGMGEIRIIKLGRWIGKESVQLPQRAQNLHRRCDDLHHQICILSNGDYAICSFDCEGQVALNVRDVPILEAFYSKAYEDLREALKGGIVGTMCENCSFSYIG